MVVHLPGALCLTVQAYVHIIRLCHKPFGFTALCAESLRRATAEELVTHQICAWAILLEAEEGKADEDESSIRGDNFD